MYGCWWLLELELIVFRVAEGVDDLRGLIYKKIASM